MYYIYISHSGDIVWQQKWTQDLTATGLDHHDLKTNSNGYFKTCLQNHGYDSWYDSGAWFGVWLAEMQHACDHKFCIRHFWKHSYIYIYTVHKCLCTESCWNVWVGWLIYIYIWRTESFSKNDSLAIKQQVIVGSGIPPVSEVGQPPRGLPWIPPRCCSC